MRTQDISFFSLGLHCVCDGALVPIYALVKKRFGGWGSKCWEEQVSLQFDLWGYATEGRRLPRLPPQRLPARPLQAIAPNDFPLLPLEA